jgi:serine/threonine-protein kinase
VSDTTPGASPVREGDIIAGKYRVEKVLGAGGMGVVVAAMHIDLEQRVALKFLLAEATSHPEVAARFAREAKAAAKIQSEHVAKVLDVATLPNGSPYMVMEFMDGEDLEHVSRKVGPMPPPVAVGYILQACEAIAEAHAVGIVHRDIKPANLFLARRPNGDAIVKVLDFGISKSNMSTSQASLTRTSAILGSPLYMSPEQMASAKSVDTRSDIWALGVVLYELLAQRPPFPADTMPELIAAVLQGQPDPITNARPDVPPELAAAIHHCLEKDPARRFQNVAEFAGALAPFGPPRSEVSVERIHHVLSSKPGMVPGNVALAPRTASSQTGGTYGSPGGPLAGGRTNAQWSDSIAGEGASGSSAKTAMLIAIPAVLAIAATIFFVLPMAGLRHAAPTTVAVAPTSSTTPVGASAAPATTATPTSDTPASASAAPSPPVASASAAPPTPDTSAAAAAPATSSPPSAPAVAPHTTPQAPPPSFPLPVPVTKPAPAPTPAAGCHRVSYMDAEGNTRFKRIDANGKDCK